MPAILTALRRASSTDIFNRESAWSGGSGSYVMRGLAAGEDVSPDNALTLSAWFAALRNLSEDIGKLPAYAVEYVGENDKQRREEHPVTRLFHVAPNTYQTPMTFRAQLQHWRLGWGNGYAEIERDPFTLAPVALHPRHPATIIPRWNETDGRVEYRYLASYEFRGGRMVSSQERIIDQDNMFHIRGLGGSALEAYSVIRLAAESLAHSIAVERFGAASFKNRGAVSAILKHPGEMGKEARSGFKDSFDAAYAGARNAGGWILLEEGMTYEQMNIAPDDMQFLQTRQMQIDEVCRWIRIPPSKIQHLMRANYNTLEMQNQEYVTDCLQGLIKDWEEQCQWKLFRSDESSHRLYHNLNSLLRGDTRAQTEHIRTMSNIGVYSINESRSFLGQNGIGPEGDKRFVAQNMMELRPNMPDPTMQKSRPAAPPAQRAVEAPTMPAMTLEKAEAIFKPAIDRASIKADKAVPRLQNKHKDCEEDLICAVHGLYSELRRDILNNTMPIWITLDGDRDALVSAIDMESSEVIDYDAMLESMVLAFLKG